MEKGRYASSFPEYNCLRLKALRQSGIIQCYEYSQSPGGYGQSPGVGIRIFC
jgi:hypothetical protein